MKKSRFSEDQMVKILREADTSSVTEVAKKHGVSEQTIYLWRKRFGQLEAVDVKRLRQIEGENAKLLFFLVVVVQLSDVFQYVWGKLIGRHPIAPAISPKKTWEGFLGGIVCAVLLGTSLWWITPFNPWQAALMSLAITLMGFAGGLVMSAVKRDRGVKDYGSLLEGHGGILDRVDSLLFAAPVFFHLTRFFF